MGIVPHRAAFHSNPSLCIRCAHVTSCKKAAPFRVVSTESLPRGSTGAVDLSRLRPPPANGANSLAGAAQFAAARALDKAAAKGESDSGPGAQAGSYRNGDSQGRSRSSSNDRSGGSAMVQYRSRGAGSSSSSGQRMSPSPPLSRMSPSPPLSQHHPPLSVQPRIIARKNHCSGHSFATAERHAQWIFRDMKADAWLTT